MFSGGSAISVLVAYRPWILFASDGVWPLGADKMQGEI
jgi:hypothetical protein